MALTGSSLPTVLASGGPHVVVGNGPLNVTESLAATVSWRIFTATLRRDAGLCFPFRVASSSGLGAGVRLAL